MMELTINHEMRRIYERGCCSFVDKMNGVMEGSAEDKDW